jgi:hypothetical protein
VFVQQAADDSRIHVPYEVAGLALVRDEQRRQALARLTAESQELGLEY